MRASRALAYCRRGRYGIQGMGEVSKKARSKKARAAEGQRQRGASGSKGVFQRQDGAGHLDPEHAARLLRLSRKTDGEDADRGFVSHPHTKDGVAEELAEGAVSAMTSGGDGIADDLNQRVDEEDGGPFVETSAAQERAQGTDESNIAGATQEPFPKTSGGES